MYGTCCWSHWYWCQCLIGERYMVTRRNNTCTIVGVSINCSGWVEEFVDRNRSRWVRVLRQFGVCQDLAETCQIVDDFYRILRCRFPLSTNCQQISISPRRHRARILANIIHWIHSSVDRHQQYGLSLLVSDGFCLRLRGWRVIYKSDMAASNLL